MKFEFVYDKLTNYRNCLFKEWLLTNGLGGYAASSIVGAHMRTHQGYLIASLHPPVDRYLVFSKTNERLVCGSRIYDLTTAQHKGPYTSEFNQGNMHLKTYKYDGTITFVYEAGGMRLTKTIGIVPGKNQCIIAYTLENNGPAAGVVITPLVNYRKQDATATVDDLRWELPPEVFTEIRDEETGNVGFYYSPVSNNNIKITVVSAGCEMVKRNNIYDENMELQYEIDNGNKGLDCHLKPYDFVMEVAEGGVSKASFVCNVDIKEASRQNKTAAPAALVIEKDTAFIEIEKIKTRIQELIDKADLDEEDELGQIFAVAADQFIVDRASTGKKSIIAGYPYDTDCGRDTLIGLTGLCLETKRYDDAKAILLAYSRLVKNGLLPNIFPEDGSSPTYNAADTALWYFYAVHNYLKYVDTDEAWKFVEDYIYPSLQEIMGAYRKGTKYGIGMDDDALMRSGDGTEPITWMDSTIRNSVGIRTGKPVEINALWYNALMTMEEISRGIARRTHNKPENYLAYAGGCSQLAIWVKEAFDSEFWYEEGGYLYDVITDDEKDSTLHPNQIFAVSLPFTMLDTEKEKSIVAAIKDNLYDNTGIKAFEGAPSWGFLLGQFIEAYLKVGGGSAQSIEEAKEFFAPIEKHIVENCIGQFSEKFENGKGCGNFASAAALGEIYRAYRTLFFQ